MFNGTSMASPQGAGAGALLLSAAKANGIEVKTAQLRKALLSTARYIDPSRFRRPAQGNGLLDVGQGLGHPQDEAPRRSTSTRPCP